MRRGAPGCSGNAEARPRNWRIASRRCVLFRCRNTPETRGQFGKGVPEDRWLEAVMIQPFAHRRHPRGERVFCVLIESDLNWIQGDTSHPHWGELAMVGDATYDVCPVSLLVPIKDPNKG